MGHTIDKCSTDHNDFEMKTQFYFPSISPVILDKGSFGTNMFRFKVMFPPSYHHSQSKFIIHSIQNKDLKIMVHYL